MTTSARRRRYYDPGSRPFPRKAAAVLRPSPREPETRPATHGEASRVARAQQKRQRRAQQRRGGA